MPDAEIAKDESSGAGRDRRDIPDNGTGARDRGGRSSRKAHGADDFEDRPGGKGHLRRPVKERFARIGQSPLPQPPDRGSVNSPQIESRRRSGRQHGPGPNVEGDDRSAGRDRQRLAVRFVLSAVTAVDVIEQQLGRLLQRQDSATGPDRVRSAARARPCLSQHFAAAIEARLAHRRADRADDVRSGVRAPVLPSRSPG